MAYIPYRRNGALGGTFNGQLSAFNAAPQGGQVPMGYNRAKQGPALRSGNPALDASVDQAVGLQVQPVPAAMPNVNMQGIPADATMMAGSDSSRLSRVTEAEAALAKAVADKNTLIDEGTAISGTRAEAQAAGRSVPQATWRDTQIERALTEADKRIEYAQHNYELVTGGNPKYGPIERPKPNVAGSFNSNPNIPSAAYPAGGEFAGAPTGPAPAPNLPTVAPSGAALGDIPYGPGGEFSPARVAPPALAPAPTTGLEPAAGPTDTGGSFKNEYTDQIMALMSQMPSASEKEAADLNDKNFALIEAGLGMMVAASKPGATALGAAGEGGLSAIKSYRGQKDKRYTREQNTRNQNIAVLKMGNDIQMGERRLQEMIRGNRSREDINKASMDLRSQAHLFNMSKWQVEGAQKTETWAAKLAKSQMEMDPTSYNKTMGQGLLGEKRSLHPELAAKNETKYYNAIMKSWDKDPSGSYKPSVGGGSDVGPKADAIKSDFKSGKISRDEAMASLQALGMK